MRQYTIKRIGLFLPTVLLVTVLVFVLMRWIPGDPALAILEDEGGGSFTQEDLARLRHELGTDRPIVVQYATWIGGVIRGDFGDGRSYPSGGDFGRQPQQQSRLCSPGIHSGGIALPTFFTAILMILFLVRVFNWLPPLGYERLWVDPMSNLQQMLLPALALAGYDMAFIAKVTRSAMMEILREDYMRTARSKGLTERMVLARHGLKNAFLPILTISGWQFGRLFGGTIIIETIFLVPGMGRILIESIGHRDYVMIQAVVVIIGLSIVTINLMIDLLYGWLDPRIRFA